MQELPCNSNIFICSHVQEGRHVAAMCVILKVQHHTVHVKQMTREQTRIELQDITVTS